MIAATRHSVTCPQATHTANKKHGLQVIWRTPAWKMESAAYKARHFPFCARCFRVSHIVSGHSGEDYSPAQMRYYIDKVRKDQVVPLCRTCNMMESKGKHPCRSHLMSGRCKRSRVYAQCEYSARDALRECNKAQARAGVVS